MRKPLDHTNRPDCEFCPTGKAENTGHKRVDGTIVYRKYEKRFICSKCRMKKYPNLKAAKYERAAHAGYKAHRLDYCENKDGRLGFKCTAKIVDRAQLQVDHIVENRGRHKQCDDPKNLQTLCANCHTMKSLYVRREEEDKLYKMLGHVYKRMKKADKKKITKKIIKSHKIKLNERYGY